jgi:hypothetical protein
MPLPELGCCCLGHGARLPSGSAIKPANRKPPAAHPSLEDVIAVYKRGIDRTLRRENLKLSVEERFRKLQQLAYDLY